MSTGTSHAKSERIVRTLTFWFRPAFVLRVLNRFQRVAGFDRAIALASGAFTALIPIMILVGAILPSGDGRSAADQIIIRYGLTGQGAQAVRDALAPAGGATTQITVFGAFLLIIAALSFSRAVQRLLEQTWDLKPLGVRNSANDIIWLGGVLVYIAFSWWVHHLIKTGRLQIATNLAVMPASALLFAWSGRVLTAGRIAWRSLLPFAIIGAVALAIGLTLGSVYIPHLFSSYAARYGVIGAVLAMISALFVLMMIVVASTVVGREVAEELDRIRRGERPPDDEVQQEWDSLITEAKLRSEMLRKRLAELRAHWRAWVASARARRRSRRDRK